VKLLAWIVSWGIALCAAAIFSQGAVAQKTSDLINPNIKFAYLTPKSPKYVPMEERLKSFQLLEQLSQFLSPLRLPHPFTLVARECGFVNAQYVSPNYRNGQYSESHIDICYEFVEALERIGPRQGQASEFTYEEVVVGALVGVLLHEAGHAVFDMLDIPVFGREEDAADEMSTFIALQFNKDVARTIIRGYAYLAKVWFAFGAPLYWDEHGTGLQRYYNTLCIGYGAAPDLFKEYMEKGELPKERATNCKNEYQQIKLAFDKTVLPFVDQDMMKKVQARSWLQFSQPQLALLKRQQQPQQQTFSFAACNLGDGTNVSLALMGKMSSDPQKWHVLGWFPIPDRACNYIGTFYGDKIYWYAESSNKIVWSAADTDRTTSKQCIDRAKAFEEIAGSKCKAGQVSVNFRLWEVEPAASGVTLRLN
jgi:hypothetical protein